MTPALPQFLTATDLPHAELQAAALDGDVFRIDRVFCSIAEFDLPWRRAAALTSVADAPAMALGPVVAGLSAAWIWGASGDAPGTHEAFHADGTRQGTEQPGFRVRTVAVDPGDIVDFGPVRVTSPPRTVVDLCRGELFDEKTATVVSRLVAEHRIQRAGCETILLRSRHFPHRARTRARLDAIGLVAAVS